MATKYPHVKRAERYARDVVKGRRIACELTRLACQRHIDDLERSKGKWPYRFDMAKAERICKFAELLPHTKGRWAAASQSGIKLEAWQCFALAILFGWVRKKDGYRRFRKAYNEISRKNGKSVLGAIVGLYMFAADGEYGAEVYSGATTEKQAWEVFRPAKLMAKRTPAFCERFGVEVNASNLNIADTGSRFEPLIGNPGDGSSPHCAVVDEFHEHDRSDLYDTMETGMGARTQPMMYVITTAGDNLAGPCYEMRSHAAKVLRGVYQDDELFALIYTLDSEDEWKSVNGLKKANPNYDISVSADFLKARIADAKRRASKQGAVKTKHCNLWVQSRAAWMNMEAWHKAGDRTLRLESFRGEPCIAALDLASRIDIASRLLVFTEVIDGKTHYYAFDHHYIPEETLADSDIDQLPAWVEEGWITATEGNEIDFNTIEADIIGEDTERHDWEGGLASEFTIDEIAYDPWQATQLAQRFTEAGARPVEIRNTVQNFSPAMKELEAAVLSGRFHHQGSPVLTWMMSNVVAKEDAKENIYPRKERPEHKIDGAVALIMGISRAMAYNADPDISQFIGSPVIA